MTPRSPGSATCPSSSPAALVEAVAGGADGSRAGLARRGGLAASGWRDMTRLARGDVAMATGIALTNGPAIATRIRDLIAVLEGWAGRARRPGRARDAALERRFADRPRAPGARRAVSEPHVLVVPRAQVPDAGRLVRPPHRGAGRRSWLRSRRSPGSSRGPAMETDPAFKQLIPYLVLRDGERYFLMQRTRSGGGRPAARPLDDRGRRTHRPG